MKHIKVNRIEKVLQKIYLGNFDEGDVALLFIWLRWDFVDNASLLDLANFVAHNNERDRGVSFEHIHKFVYNFIEVSEKGGSIYGLPSVFNKERVIKDLEEVLETLGLKIDKDKIENQSTKIIDCLLELMEETEFRFEDSRIVRCFLKRNGQKMTFCLNLDLKGPFIITSHNTIIQSNLFD